MDFSARSAPSPARPAADAIWLGRRWPGGRATATYYRTREQVFAVLADVLADEMTRGRRVLLGVDFALGYPAGFARAAGLGGRGPAWRRTWRYLNRNIEDGPDNANNRFAVAAALNARCATRSEKATDRSKNSAGGGGPFWGCPPGGAGAWLSARRDGVDSPLPRRRLVEQCVPSAHEVWKLYTTGSVGSQTLLGLARLEKLRGHPGWQDRIYVWPFDRGFGPTPMPDDQPGVVVAEVYPSLVNGRADALLTARKNVTIRDQAQVLALAEHFAELDRAGRLTRLFDTPADLSPADAQRCVREEGWILGV
ncbi:MAG: hypothetical protein AAGL98_02235 [Planctomycetota bacterium]